MANKEVRFIGEDDLVEVASSEDYLLEIHFWSTELLGEEDQDSINIPLHHPYQYLNCRAVLFFEQKILNGRYKYSAIISWKPVGSNSPKASDKLRLARFLSDLPDADFLNQISHFNQLCRWLQVKDYMLYVAKCWLAGSDGQPDNPLLRDLEEGKIEPFLHEMIWFSTHLYLAHWNLISLKWKLIKSKLKRSKWECPFTSGRDLLEEIIKTEVNAEFSGCLQPFFELKPNELNQLFTLSRHNLTTDLAPNKEIQRKNLVKKYGVSNLWHERLIEILRDIAKTAPLAYALLVERDAILDGICKMEQDALCKPELKKIYNQPETWKNGKRYLRSRQSNLWKNT